MIVKEEDAPRINRIVDRFQFASVTEAAKIKTEIERTRAEKQKAGKSEKQEKKPEKGTGSAGKQGQAEPEKDYPQKSKEDQLMDELLETGKERGEGAKPSWQRRPNPRLSEPTSKERKTAEGTSKLFIRKTRETIGPKGTSGNTECKGKRRSGRRESQK